VKHLALILAVLVGATHYAYPLLATQTQQQWAFYIMQGVQAVGLLAIILAGILAWGKGPWKAVGIAACIVGMIEEIMCSMCGLISYFVPVNPTPWQGLCGAHADMPVAAIALGVALAAGIAYITRPG
jgi:RsiW-degrading membrane proteinase PrsW (M82 family)